MKANYTIFRYFCKRCILTLFYTGYHRNSLFKLFNYFLILEKSTKRKHTFGLKFAAFFWTNRTKMNDERPY